MSHVDELIADLKDAVREAKLKPSGTGTMVTLYGMSCPFWPSTVSLNISYALLFIGLGKSNAVGPTMVGHLATAFLDALYKA